MILSENASIFKLDSGFRLIGSCASLIEYALFAIFIVIIIVISLSKETDR